MTLAKTLILSVGGTAAFSLGLAVWAFSSVERLGGEVSTAVEQTGRKMVVVSDLRASILTARTANRGVMLFSSIHEAAAVEKARAAYRTAHSQIISELADMRSLLQTDDGRQLVGEIEKNLELYTQHHENLAALCAQDRTPEAVKIDSGVGVQLGTAMSKAADDLMSRQTRWNQESLARSAGIRANSRLATVALLLACLGISLWTAFSAKGIIRRLRGLSNGLKQSAEELLSVSMQVSSSGRELARAATDQAASLSETSASTEEITSMTRANAESSRTVAELMKATSQGVADANQSVGEMQASMREINTSSDKIAKIIRVIDEIAFQTNILALNAAVEAARAGEAGMGFAVVADEVRNLAQRSAQAARDTASMIEESIAKSKEGSSKLDRVSSVIHGITQSAQKVKILVDDVKAGSEQQSRGIDSIAATIVQMERVTQQSAAGAQETAAASTDIHRLVDNLKTAVEQLGEVVGVGLN